MSIFDNLQGHALSAHEKADAALRHLETQGGVLAEIAQHTEAALDRQTAQRVPFVMDVDAGGVGRAILQVPQGIAWGMTSFAFVGNAAGNFAIYMGSEDGNGLLAVLAIPAAPSRLSGLFAGEEYIPQGGQVIVTADGQTPGTQVRGNLKVAVQGEGQSGMKGP